MQKRTKQNYVIHFISTIESEHAIFSSRVIYKCMHKYVYIRLYGDNKERSLAIVAKYCIY